MGSSEIGTIHPFELAGLGSAPFVYRGWKREVGPIRLADGTQIGSPGQAMGCCSYCGQGIATVVLIESADGRRFGVGLDCAKKLYRADNAIADAATKVQNEIRQQQREAAREERRKQREAARNAELAAQRERNGGLTDREIEAQRRADQAAAARDRYSVENAWILDVLRAVPAGDFVSSMIAKLETAAFGELSPRAAAIVADIYVKQTTGSRRGSKRYNAAIEEFETRAGNVAGPRFVNKAIQNERTQAVAAAVENVG